MEITVGSTVLWKGLECIVTNAFICKGRYIQVSPKGNGNSPAKYYQVRPEKVWIKPK